MHSIRDLMTIVNESSQRLVETFRTDLPDPVANWAFWMSARNFTFVDVTSSNHTLGAIEHLKVSSRMYRGGNEDENVINAAIQKGWVRGNYTAHAHRLFLQGNQNDLPRIAHHLVKNGVELNQVILEYSGGGGDELNGNMVNWWLKTGKSPSQMSRLAQFREAAEPDPIEESAIQADIYALLGVEQP